MLRLFVQEIIGYKKYTYRYEWARAYTLLLASGSVKVPNFSNYDSQMLSANDGAHPCLSLSIENPRVKLTDERNSDAAAFISSGFARIYRI